MNEKVRALEDRLSNIIKNHEQEKAELLKQIEEKKKKYLKEIEETKNLLNERNESFSELKVCVYYFLFF